MKIEYLDLVQNYEFFIYIDRDNSGHVYYVGLGDKLRIYDIERNDYHNSIAKSHGLNRSIEYACNDYDILNEMEILFIQHYNTYWYENKEARVSNFTKGGGGIRGYKFSDEAKKKMSEDRTGEGNAFYGRTHSNEVKEKLGELWTGENNPMKKQENKDKLIERLYSENNPMKKQVNKDKLSKRVSGENNPAFKFGKDVIDKILELRKQGLSYDKISKETNVSISRIGVIINENMQEENKKYRKNYNLSKEDNENVLKLRNEGMEYKQISEKTGISTSQICRICKGKNGK